MREVTSSLFAPRRLLRTSAGKKGYNGDALSDCKKCNPFKLLQVR